MEANEQAIQGPVLRCKVRVSEVLHVKEANGSTNQERVKLRAVYDGSEENQTVVQVYINNPAAFGKLSNGHEFFIDFTPAK